MNGTTIIVDYDPFARESRAYIMNEGNREKVYTVESNMATLSEKLVAMAFENDIYNMRIHGPSAITDEIRRSIKEYEMRTYEKNKIIVEGF